MDKQNVWRACTDRDVMYGPTENVWRDYGHGYTVWTNRECMDRDVMYGPTENVWRDYGHGYTVWTNRERMDRDVMYGQTQNIWRKCMDKHTVYEYYVWTRTECMNRKRCVEHRIGACLMQVLSSGYIWLSYSQN